MAAETDEPMRPAEKTGSASEPQSTRSEDDSPPMPKAADHAAPDGQEDAPAEGSTVKNLFRILSYSTPLDRAMMLVSGACSVGAGVTLPLMNIIFGNLIGGFNGFSAGSDTNPQALVAAFSANVNQQALYLIYLWVAKFALAYVAMFGFRMAGIRISAAVRLAYLEALFAQSINRLDRQPPGSTTDALSTVANTIQMGISDKLALFLQGLALIISAFAVAFKYSWQLTLAGTGCLIFMMAYYGVLVPVLFKYQKAVDESSSGASGVAGETLKAIRTIKSLCAEPAIMARYERWVVDGRAAAFKQAPLLGMMYSPLYFVTYATMALIFWLGTRLFLQGTVSSVSNVVITLFSVLIVVTALNLILSSLQNIIKAASASETCFRIIDLPRLSDEGLRDPEVDPKADLEFRDVHFTYPSRPDSEVLKGMSLRIPAGKITALVGPSGCGKSTIVALLERWYDLSDTNARLPDPAKDESKMTPTEKMEHSKAQKELLKAKKKAKKAGVPFVEESRGPLSTILQNSGSVSVGPHSLESVSRTWWRSQIGLVQQEPALFNDNIFETVAKGLGDATRAHLAHDEQLARVKEACQEAFAAEFIEKLPKGYETMVGEGGVKLSGGQRQRLAIARGIVKRPSILILDEATSSIDVRAERIVQKALDRVSQGRTTLVIAHRLSTIKKADNVVVLRDGAAVESGTHSSLLGIKDGFYASLVHAQDLKLGSEDEQEAKEDAETLEMEPELLLQKSRSRASRRASRHDNEEAELTTASEEQKSASKKRPLGFTRAVGLLVWEQRHHRGTITLLLLGALGCGGVYAVQSYLVAQLITVFQLPPNQMQGRADFWALMLFILSLFVIFSYGALGWSVGMMGAHIGSTYRREYFESMLGKPVAWFDEEDHSSGTLTGQISSDPTLLQTVMGSSMIMPLVGMFNILGSVVISFCFGWKLTLVVLFSALPVLVGAALMRVRYELQFASYNSAVFSESSQFAAESVGAFRTVTALTLEDSILRRYRTLLDDHVRKAFKRAPLAVLVFALADSAEFPCMALAFWYGGQLLSRGEYDAVQFFVIYTAVVQGAQAAGQFLAFGSDGAQATAATNRIISLRGEPEVTYSDEKTPPNAGGEKEDSQQRGASIEFQNVGFTYPQRPDRPVYRGLSFKVPAGGYAALVGPSGSGKTTVVNLLERMYQYDSGVILVDGVPVTDAPLAEYRRGLALVEQEPKLLSGTVRDNLVLGLPHEPSDEELEEVCRAAEIHDFVTSLEQGYGTSLAAGAHASLSGGQKQRLCIARALLRRPRLLLLDEATSSLDSQSEAAVKRAVDRVAEGGKVTVLAVAHRLATIQNAHTIIVLGEGGSVLEIGTHEELRDKGGVYYAMCMSQALGA